MIRTPAFGSVAVDRPLDPLAVAAGQRLARACRAPRRPAWPGPRGAGTRPRGRSEAIRPGANPPPRPGSRSLGGCGARAACPGVSRLGPRIPGISGWKSYGDGAVCGGISPDVMILSGGGDDHNLRRVPCSGWPAGAIVNRRRPGHPRARYCSCPFRGLGLWFALDHQGGLLCAPILAFGVGHDGPERVASSRDLGRDSP